MKEDILDLVKSEKTTRETLGIIYNHIVNNVEDEFDEKYVDYKEIIIELFKNKNTPEYIYTSILELYKVKNF